jgi:4-amino-4-deoxy-L-arabinose transferase-like glycosyltransferase
MRLSLPDRGTNEVLIVLPILLLAAVLRFWRLDEYLTFLGDQGRDALLVERMLIEGARPLVGPPASAGDIHFGPAYYYLLAIPMWLFWLNPVAAAGMVATLAVAGVGLLYYLARSWFGRAPAVAAALLYSVSALSIVSARTAWNPNPLPFFALVTACSLYEAHRRADPRWYVPAAGSLAMALQLHYSAILLLPAALAAWVATIRSHTDIGRGRSRRNFMCWSAASLGIFAACALSFLVVSASGGPPDHWARGISSTDWTRLRLADAPARTAQIYANGLVGKNLAAEHSILTAATAICLLGPLLRRGNRRGGAHAGWGLVLIATWLTVGVCGLAATPLVMQDHYLACLAPAAYLLFAAFIASIWSARPGLPEGIRHASVFGITAALVTANILQSPLREPPDRDLARAETVARFIHEHADGGPYRLLVVSDRSFEAAYAFHLSLYGETPLEASQPTGQVFVVCELSECDPLREARAALPASAPARIDLQLQLDRADIYRVVT